jgi:protein ImuA
MHRAGNAAPLLAGLRSTIARIGRPDARATAGTLPFGIPAIDRHLPGGGLALGALHEVASAGPDIEHGAAAGLLLGGVVARLPGTALWVLARRDLFAPALARVGLPPERLLVVEAEKDVLLVMEEGLRHAGLAAVVGEVSARLTLTASRRLQLAAEQSGVTAFVLRRSRKHDDPALREPTAATTRWQVRSIPSPPPLAHAPDTPGLGPQLWQLDLTRCRGAAPSSWTVEASDAQGHLHLSADLADRPLAPGQGRRAAAA